MAALGVIDMKDEEDEEDESLLEGLDYDKDISEMSMISEKNMIDEK